jgi:hypothetical protein
VIDRDAKPDNLILHRDTLRPEACDGGLPSALPACGRAPTCTACLRCRDHCRCTAGADARGSR